MAMLATILFDAYGTLLDTKNGSVLATEAILQRNGSGLDPGQVYAAWKACHRMLAGSLKVFMKESELFLLGLRRIYSEFGINGHPEEDVKIMLATLGVRQVFPETLAVVAELRQKYKVYIASNTDDEPLLRDMSRNGLMVDGVFTSESLRVYKPDKDFYVRVLYRLGLGPEAVVFVGDSLVDDITVPHSIGMKTVWVNRKNLPLQEGMPKPDYGIADLRGLISIL